jgi:hypothetical protein
MRALIWKEWRENVKWAAVPPLLLLVPIALYGLPWLMDFGDLYYLSLVAAMFGAVLGFLQVFPESRGDKRALLLHRPLSRSRIFLGKALAGVGLYLLALGIPFACAVAWAATPGYIAKPFRWPMALPWLADTLTGLVYYFAGMLTAQREARWYGSRCLGLAAGLCCSLLVWTLPEFGQALAAVVLVGGAVAVAAWGSFLAGGAYGPQPLLAKVALAATLLTGLSALSFLGNYLLGRWLEPRTTYFSLLDHNGRVLSQLRENGEILSVTDLEGRLPPEFQGARPEVHALNEAAATGVRGDTAQTRSYRSWNRFLIEIESHSRPANEVWWYVPDQGRLVGYDKHSKRRIGSFGPDGFAPPGDPPRERFRGPLDSIPFFYKALAPDYLTFPGGVYVVDFRKRTVQTLFTPAAGEAVRWASKWQDEKRQLILTFVATDKAVHVVDGAGTRVLSAPLAYDRDAYGVRSAGRLEGPQRYWIWYEPHWYLGLETLEVTPAYVVQFDGNGREVVRQAVPPRPGGARWIGPRDDSVEPSPVLALLGFVTPPAEAAILVGTTQYLEAEVGADDGRGRPPLLPVLLFTTQFFIPGVRWLPRAHAGLVFSYAAWMLLAAGVSALVCLLLARRYAFSRARCLGWTLCGLLWGPAGLLLLLALHEGPARIACPRCRKPRVVTRDLCEHCGAAHAVPAVDGTEIFESSLPPVPAAAAR